MNVILIVSDTLRRDHIGCYGNRRIHTPNMDALARRSVVFDRHYAASFPTMPARADFLLGKWTFTYMGWEPFPVEDTPLPQRLEASGFETVGVVDTPFYTLTGMGYDRGFTHFFDMKSQLTNSGAGEPLFPTPRLSEYDYCAPGTFVQAERCLDRVAGRPFFLLVDTWDPHEPWDPPDPYVRLYRPDYDGRVVTPPYGYIGEKGVSEEDLAIAHDCYMGEITMVDRWLGRLMERVESLGIAQETAVVFTTDHGFYFGEHGGLFGKMVRQGEFSRLGPTWLWSPLYEEVVHLPLMVYVPGVEPRRVSALTSAVDLMPTMAELAGVTLPDSERLHGRSMVPLLSGGGAGRDFVVSALPLANPGQGLQVVDHRS
ncbi:MAG: sulfatase, partial [Chloroflexota bacterium]